MTSTPQENNDSWWSRPSGGREVLRIALPMVASTMSWTLMSFIDSTILYRVSAQAMAAAFGASLTWFALLSLLWGICSYGSTFVSQYFGDDQPEKIGLAVWQGVWLALGFGPLAIAAIPLAPHLFSMHSAELAELETRFFQVLCWGAPAMLAAQALEAFYSGQGKTRVVMVVDMVAVLVNLILAVVLVLGVGTGRSFGVEGAAAATVGAQWFRALFYATLVLKKSNRERFKTWDDFRFDMPQMQRLIRYGGPSGVQMMLDIVGFTVFVQMVGKLGLLEAEATSMAFRVSHVAFMPVWGFGIATTVLVGQRLGENRSDLAARATWTSLVIAIAYMGFISTLFAATPNLFLQMFVNHEATPAASGAGVRELAVDLLRFVAAYNLLDAVVITFVCTLKGAGDTRFIMGVSLVMATALSVLTWFGVRYWHWNIYGCWTLVTAYVWALGVIYAFRFKQGRWRSMRVIVQTHHTPPGDQELEESIPAGAIAE